MADVRIRCEVIGCKRTASAAKYPEGTIIICGKCLRLAPKHLRRRLRRIKHLGRKRGIDWKTVMWADAVPGTPIGRLLRLHSDLFDQVVKAAANVTVGIG